MVVRLCCVVCGLLGFWAYPRSDDELKMMKEAHLARHSEHEVTWEKTNED